MDIGQSLLQQQALPAHAKRLTPESRALGFLLQLRNRLTGSMPGTNKLYIYEKFSFFAK